MLPARATKRDHIDRSAVREVAEFPAPKHRASMIARNRLEIDRSIPAAPESLCPAAARAKTLRFSLGAGLEIRRADRSCDPFDMVEAQLGSRGTPRLFSRRGHEIETVGGSGFFIGALHFCAGNAQAQTEGTPCAAEPTDQLIAYGDNINDPIGAIGLLGDSDLFRFQGAIGDAVTISVVVYTQRAAAISASCALEPDFDRTSRRLHQCQI